MKVPEFNHANRILKAVQESGVSGKRLDWLLASGRFTDFLAGTVAEDDRLIRKRPESNSTFRIRTDGGYSQAELLKAGRYLSVPKWLINRNSPLSFAMPASVQIDLLTREDMSLPSLDGFGWSRRDRWQEIVARRGVRMGYGRPLWEYALFFGAQHRKVLGKGPVAFLHEPFRTGLGRSYIYFGAGGLLIGSLKDRDYSEYRFAFAKPPPRSE